MKIPGVENFSPDPSNLRYILRHGSAIFFFFALKYKDWSIFKRKCVARMGRGHCIIPVKIDITMETCCVTK